MPLWLTATLAFGLPLWVAAVGVSWWRLQRQVKAMRDSHAARLAWAAQRARDESSDRYDGRRRL